MTLTLSSPAFADGQSIPAKYARDFRMFGRLADDAAT